MELIMLSEISQTLKDKYLLFSLMWNLDLNKNKKKKRGWHQEVGGEQDRVMGEYNQSA
jgi:hypothetical protein